MTGVAVIGCGQWGANHVRVFGALPEAMLLAVADPDPTRLERVREFAPLVRREFDYRLLLADRSIEAVVIATPAASHYETVRDALLAGKHVLCEKPLCLSAGQACELVEMASAASRLLMVGHVFLFNGGIVKLKQLIDAGEIGEILYLAASRTNLGPIRSDVNAAQDLASHDIAIFNWLLGAEPELVSAMGESFLHPSIDDVVFISLRYPGGVVANVRASWLDPKKVRQLTTVGTRKMATWDDLAAPRPLALYDRGASTTPEYGSFGEFLRLSVWYDDVHLPPVDPREPLQVQAAAFLSYLRRGHVERSDGAFAAGVVRVLDAINRSLAEQGAPARVRSEPSPAPSMHPIPTGG